ncbi:MAG: hypothetical protein E7I99_10465 [Streptococcus mitis]|nr:hypothetical protein [Streptococcus mitis]
MKLNYKASFIYKMLLILSRQNHAVIAYICYNKLIIKSERMINLKKGEITISFSNHTFHLNLNEGESIDIRLKNDDGNIYMGQADDKENTTINHKKNGYSSVGLSEQKQKELLNESPKIEETTSSIHKILENEEKKNDDEVVQEDELSQNDEKITTEVKEQTIENDSGQIEIDESSLSDSDKTTIIQNESDNDTTSASEKVNDEERNERDNTSKEKTSSIVHRYMPLEDDEDEE